MFKKAGCIILLTFFLMALNACHRDNSDPGEYSYTIPGSNYTVYHVGSHAETGNISLSDGHKTVIPNRLTGIVWDQSYILISQIDTLPFSPVPSGESVQTHFYIIQVKPERNIYGPLTEEEFEQKRTELGISSDLMLQNPDKFKNVSSLPSKNILNVKRGGMPDIE